MDNYRVRNFHNKTKALSLASLIFLFLVLTTYLYAATSPWSQTTWSGGSGQSTWNNADQFESLSNLSVSTTGQIALLQTANWYNSSWRYRKTLTIDETKVSGSTNLTNFPVLISLTDADLSGIAQPDGDDILFTDTSGSKLSHEIEQYNSETGALTTWVLVPTLNGATNTTLFMYYGNAIAANQQDIVDGTNDVFGSDYAGVWHMHNAPANNGTQQDSTINNRDGTFIDADADSNTNTTGIAGPAYTFAGDSDSIQLSDWDITSGPLTLSAWFKTTKVGGFQRLISKDVNGQWLLIGTQAVSPFNKLVGGGLNDGAAWLNTSSILNYNDG